VRRLPSPAGDWLSDGGNSRGSLRIVSGLAENTNSIFCADSLESHTAARRQVLTEFSQAARLNLRRLTDYRMLPATTRISAFARLGQWVT
jgi:hypothetical protein